MIERVIILDAVDPVTFYGVNNANVQVIKNLFPKVRIAARGNVMKVIGDEKETELFEQKIKQLEKYCAEYNQLGEEVIIDIIKGDEPQTVKPLENLIIYGVNGKPITGRTPNQQKLVEAFAHNDLTFALGAGRFGQDLRGYCSGREGSEKQGGEEDYPEPSRRGGRREAGFPAGDMKDKIDPYLQTALRCAGRYDSGRQAEGVHGVERDTDCPVGLHARPYVERCGHHSRRGAEHHDTPR